MNEIATPRTDDLAGRIHDGSFSVSACFYEWDKFASQLERELIESHKALDAIDLITSSDSMCELEMRDRESMDNDLKEAMDALDLIYKIAHSESPNHTCHAVHGGWRTLKSKVLETGRP